MKRFLHKIFGHFFISFILLNITSQLLFDFQIKKNSIVDKILRQSRKSGESHILYIGDSVGMQILSGRENAFATNMNVLMAGQYIIVREFIKRNPQIKQIIFLGLPTSLGRQFETSGSYSFFLEPFFSIKFLKYFSPLLLNKINFEKKSYLTLFPLFKYSNFISDINFDKYNKLKMGEISDISIEYISKLIHFTKNNNIELHFISPPLNKNYSITFNNWKPMKNKMRKEFGNTFDNYWKNIKVYPDTCFADYAHFDKVYLKNNRENIFLDLISEEILKRFSDQN